MNKRKAVLLGAALVCFLSIVLLLSPLRVRLVGHLRGEKFYRGLPTSCWGQKLEAQGSAGSRPAPFFFLRWFTGPADSHDPDLWALTRADPDATPVLVELLTSNSRHARLTAIAALRVSVDTRPGSPGPEEAVPALCKLAESQDPSERQEARFLLKKLDPQAAARLGVP